MIFHQNKEIDEMSLESKLLLNAFYIILKTSKTVEEAMEKFRVLANTENQYLDDLPVPPGKPD